MDVAKSNNRTKLIALLEASAEPQAAASTPEMEEELRQAADNGDEAALKALLDAKVVNIEAKRSGVSGWVVDMCRRSSHAPAPLPDDASPGETLAVEAPYSTREHAHAHGALALPSPSPPPTPLG